jgi:hypothetical protein
LFGILPQFYQKWKLLRLVFLYLEVGLKKNTLVHPTCIYVFVH